jgi:hypothetical protein
MSYVLRCFTLIDQEPILARTRRSQVIIIRSIEVEHLNELYTGSIMINLGFPHSSSYSCAASLLLVLVLIPINSFLESFLQTEPGSVMQPCLRFVDVHGMSEVGVLHSGNGYLGLSMAKRE